MDTTRRHIYYRTALYVVAIGMAFFLVWFGWTNVAAASSLPANQEGMLVAAATAKTRLRQSAEPIVNQPRCSLARARQVCGHSLPPSLVRTGGNTVTAAPAARPDRKHGAEWHTAIYNGKIDSNKPSSRILRAIRRDQDEARINALRERLSALNIPFTI